MFTRCAHLGPRRSPAVVPGPVGRRTRRSPTTAGLRRSALRRRLAPHHHEADRGCNGRRARRRGPREHRPARPVRRARHRERRRRHVRRGRRRVPVARRGRRRRRARRPVARRGGHRLPEARCGLVAGSRVRPGRPGGGGVPDDAPSPASLVCAPSLARRQRLGGRPLRSPPPHRRHARTALPAGSRATPDGRGQRARPHRARRPPRRRRRKRRRRTARSEGVRRLSGAPP